MTTEEDLGWIGERLNAMRHYLLLDEAAVQILQPVDYLLYQAGLLGSEPAGAAAARRTQEAYLGFIGSSESTS